MTLRYLGMTLKDIVGFINVLVDDPPDSELTEDERRRKLHEFAWILVNATREEDTNG